MKKLGLSTRVFIGFGLGILLGVIFGEKILVIKIIGDIFLKLIKMLTVPLVFFSIISGITNLTDVNKLKRVGAKILGMYVVTTLLAGFIGLGIAHLINPGVGFQIDSSAIGSYEATAMNSVSDTLLAMVPDNIINAMANTNMMGIIIFCAIFGCAKTVLHDISLYAQPGQKIAFVGATGAGKTTITNLINRFYDIDDGKIRYDGININKIKKADLRRSLGVVLQEVNLFTGTVMENLRYGNPNASDEDCIAAAKFANASGFIRMLPQGYNTVLKGDGSGLSQGQRQLISIARAAVSDPPVMILDEATSSIDTRTEALVQDGMDRLMKGRTVFVIAHRLSTVQNADVIMVLDHGRIIERGSHEKLMAEKGTYYQLYTGAFELE